MQNRRICHHSHSLLLPFAAGLHTQHELPHSSLLHPPLGCQQLSVPQLLLHRTQDQHLILGLITLLNPLFAPHLASLEEREFCCVLLIICVGVDVSRSHSSRQIKYILCGLSSVLFKYGADLRLPPAAAPAGGHSAGGNHRTGRGLSVGSSRHRGVLSASPSHQ